MSPTYGATAAFAASAPGGLGSSGRPKSASRAASSASRRFLASSASASIRAADRVLGFDGRGAEQWFVFGPVDVRSSARALRLPRGLLRGGAECAEFSLLSIASDSGLRLRTLMLLPTDGMDLRIRSSDCLGFPLGFAGFGWGRAMSEAPAFVWGLGEA